MIILGLVGMPKSGKGEAVKALIPEGWTHVSVSNVLAQMIMRENPKYQHVKDPRDIPREILSDEATHFKEASNNGGILAEECIRMIEGLPPKKREKVVIDGIRHPGEIETIMQKYPHSHFLGIIADEDRDKDFEIRWKRFRENMTQRGDHFEPHRKDKFKQRDAIEWDNPASEFGTKIGRCLDMVAQMKATGQGNILINGENKKLEILAEEVQEYARSLEGTSGNPERVM